MPAEQTRSVRYLQSLGFKVIDASLADEEDEIAPIEVAVDARLLLSECHRLLDELVKIGLEVTNATDPLEEDCIVLEGYYDPALEEAAIIVWGLDDALIKNRVGPPKELVN